MNLENICNSLDNVKKLVMIDDCFSIIQRDKILTQLCCMKNLVSPVDGYRRYSELIASNSTYVLFDNKFDISPDNTLQYQTRGFMIWVNYPTLDTGGFEVQDADLNAIIRLTNNLNISFDIPFYNFFNLLNNPITTDIMNLVNKVEIVNDNDYNINVEILTIIVGIDGVGVESIGSC